MTDQINPKEVAAFADELQLPNAVVAELQAQLVEDPDKGHREWRRHVQRLQVFLDAVEFRQLLTRAVPPESEVEIVASARSELPEPSAIWSPATRRHIAMLYAQDKQGHEWLRQLWETLDPATQLTVQGEMSFAAARRLRAEDRDEHASERLRRAIAAFRESWEVARDPLALIALIDAAAELQDADELARWVDEVMQRSSLGLELLVTVLAMRPRSPDARLAGELAKRLLQQKLTGAAAKLRSWLERMAQSPHVRELADKIASAVMSARDPNAWYERAQKQVDAGDHGNAVTSFERALELEGHPADTEWRLVEASFLGAMSRGEPGNEHGLRDALERWHRTATPPTPHAWTTLGRIHQYLSYHERDGEHSLINAIAHLERGIAEGGTWIGSWAELSRCYERLGYQGLAILSATVARQRAPEDSSVWEALLVARVNAGHIRAALSLARRPPPGYAEDWRESIEATLLREAKRLSEAAAMFARRPLRPDEEWQRNQMALGHFQRAKQSQHDMERQKVELARARHLWTTLWDNRPAPGRRAHIRRSAIDSILLAGARVAGLSGKPGLARAVRDYHDAVLPETVPTEGLLMDFAISRALVAASQGGDALAAFWDGEVPEYRAPRAARSALEFDVASGEFFLRRDEAMAALEPVAELLREWVLSVEPRTPSDELARLRTRHSDDLARWATPELLGDEAARCGHYDASLEYWNAGAESPERAMKESIARGLRGDRASLRAIVEDPGLLDSVWGTLHAPVFDTDLERAIRNDPKVEHDARFVLCRASRFTRPHRLALPQRPRDERLDLRLDQSLAELRQELSTSLEECTEALAREFGFELPPTTIVDESGRTGRYTLLTGGTLWASGVVVPGRRFVVSEHAVETTPWGEHGEWREGGEGASPATYILRHVELAIRRNASALLGFDGLVRLTRAAGLQIKEPVALLRVAREALREQIPIRIEALVAAAEGTPRSDQAVMMRYRAKLGSDLRGLGSTATLLGVSERLEERLRMFDGESSPLMALEPTTVRTVLGAVRAAVVDVESPTLVVRDDLRRGLANLVAVDLFGLPVVGRSEVGGRQVETDAIRLEEA